MFSGLALNIGSYEKHQGFIGTWPPSIGSYQNHQGFIGSWDWTSLGKKYKHRGFAFLAMNLGSYHKASRFIWGLTLGVVGSYHKASRIYLRFDHEHWVIPEAWSRIYFGTWPASKHWVRGISIEVSEVWSWTLGHTTKLQGFIWYLALNLGSYQKRLFAGLALGIGSDQKHQDLLVLAVAWALVGQRHNRRGFSYLAMSMGSYQKHQDVFWGLAPSIWSEA